MTFTTMTRGHLLIALLEYQRASLRLAACLHDQDKQPDLPGAFRDCSDTLAALINNAGAADPAISEALAHGRRSTRRSPRHQDPVPPRDYAEGDDFPFMGAPV